MIFFESNGNGTGTFKGWKELTSASGSPLEMNTDIVFDFSDIGLKTTDAYDILAVANMGSNYLPTDGSQSMDDWKNAIKNSNFKQPGRKYRLYGRYIRRYPRIYYKTDSERSIAYERFA